MRVYMSLLPGLLLLGAFASASNCLPNKCNADNCYRQVVASSFTTRHNSADCSSFLAATVTPSTVTISQTVTVTQTASVTDTETVDFTVLATESDILTVTAVSTDIISVTDDVTETVTVPATSSAPLLQRRVPSSVPYYASSCTSQGQYASACSCIGILPFTVTAPTPSTTVVVTVSPTITATYSAVVSVGTTETLTSLLTVTTTAVVSESVTVTETVQTATVAAGPCGTDLPVFKLDFGDDNYAGWYVEGGLPTLVLRNSPDASLGAELVLNGTGSTGSLIDFQTIGPGLNPTYSGTTQLQDGTNIGFAFQGSIDSFGFTPVICSIDFTASTMSCFADDYVLVVANNGFNLVIELDPPATPAIATVVVVGCLSYATFLSLPIT